VHGLGVDGAPVQLESAQPTIHEKASLADSQPMRSLEPIALRLLGTSSVLGLLVGGASALACRDELPAVRASYLTSTDPHYHSGLISS
jgi:hypothetical protein